MRQARAALRVFLFLLWVLWVIPTQSLILALHKGKGVYIVPNFWNRGVCRIFGIRYEIRGRPSKDRQTIYMSNHVSYMDVPVLGGLLPASFLAKQEVESWPLFGFLAKLQLTVYILRRRTAIAGEKSKIEQFLDSGRSMIVFPEGTSSSGLHVLPFKTSLFEMKQAIDIQPVTIAIVETDGKKAVTKEEHDIYAWPLEMETPLHIHLWQFAKTPGAKLVIAFHEPIHAKPGDDRKILAKACYDSVCKGLETAKV